MPKGLFDAGAANQLAKAGKISPKAMGKLKGLGGKKPKGLKKLKLAKPKRGSQIPLASARGGVGKGMSGM